MRDTARDPATLEMELLRMQRDRLADRLRPPRWYLAGSAVAWAVGFTGQFTLRYLPRVDYWSIGAAQLAAWCLLQWGLARVSLAVGETEFLLLRHGLLAAAIVAAAFGVAVEVALQQAWLRGVRQALRDGQAAA